MKEYFVKVYFDWNSTGDFIPCKIKAKDVDEIEDVLNQKFLNWTYFEYGMGEF